MQRLTPTLRHYDWGTTDDIPRLLGFGSDGTPYAEAWWGAHDSAPSWVPDEHGHMPLDELIAQHPVEMLGADAVERWGARLPYLLKILAIEKPLSIQVHPTLEQAREGFAREQRGTGGAPHSFLDPFHKPEMVVAITPMRVLAGVRDLEDTAADLRALGTERADVLAGALARAEDAEAFLADILTRGADEETYAALARVGAASAPGTSLRAAADALGYFPQDPGAIVALALNLVELEPGEAVFTGAGILHSYQSGLGVEIMANSDNVVRAGLTPKHIDVPLLLTLANAVPAEAERPKETREGAVRRLETVEDEFALTVVNEGEATVGADPRIVLCVTGTASVAAGDEVKTLTAGQALFVRAAEGDARIVAEGITAVAHTACRRA
ncbi:mannose-6-phosphate isomerase, class I [Demequina sp. NBRC 110051]|uniref:mannose-6-phosphate isomerase, class I n=1 Tax=Demequina sp. NBRC 110051 TaxID=1570340 RepID=UPI0009FF5396|nr:mannose-6-phosphate isomerase, class I [Demequina sp. NBRC 110051]